MKIVRVQTHINEFFSVNLYEVIWVKNNPAKAHPISNYVNMRMPVYTKMHYENKTKKFVGKVNIVLQTRFLAPKICYFVYFSYVKIKGFQCSKLIALKETENNFF